MSGTGGFRSEVEMNEWKVEYSNSLLETWTQTQTQTQARTRGYPKTWSSFHDLGALRMLLSAWTEAGDDVNGGRAFLLGG